MHIYKLDLKWPHLFERLGQDPDSTIEYLNQTHLLFESWDLGHRTDPGPVLDQFDHRSKRSWVRAHPLRWTHEDL